VNTAGEMINRLREDYDYRIKITSAPYRGAVSRLPIEAADLIEQQASRIAGLEASRIAYASEFPLDAEGLPDVGNIHANIRAMKTRAAELAIHLDLMTKEFVRMYPLYYYAEPWAHDRNQVLKAALAALSQKEANHE